MIWKRRLVPFTVLLQSIWLFVFYAFGNTHSKYWGTYFHCGFAFPLAIVFILPIIFKRNTYILKQFQIVGAAYNFGLGIVFILNRYEIINSERLYLGIWLSTVTIIITTIMVLFSGIRHGLF